MKECTMYKLCIVDDEEKIRALIKKYALFEGYEVKEAENGMQAIEMCQREDFDLVVMDIMMPELDGFSACKKIREFSEVPVIMLSARGEEYDKIHGFEIGVDDYIVKPFSPKELMMRVQAVLKRSKASQEIAQKDIMQSEGLKIDFTGRLVYIDEEKIDMSPKEYELLFYMAKNKGVALRREQLLNQVWGYDFYGDDRTLDTHIKLLRRALDTIANL